MKKFTFAAIAFVLLFGLGLSQNLLNAASGGIKVSDIHDMLKAGIPEDLVIAKLRKVNQEFDLSAQEMVQLKKDGVSDNIIKVMLDPVAPVTSSPGPIGAFLGIATPKASGATPDAGTAEAAIAANLNNPDAPHDSGIYLYTEKPNQKVMIVLERASYQGTKTGGMFGFGMTGGILKAKSKAVIPGPRASIRTSDPRPQFYFYFEEKSAGLGKSGFGGQTVSNPNQFALLKLEVKKDNRETVTGKVGLTGMSMGTDEKSMVAFKADRLRPGVYRVIPTANMESGEYCFMASGFGAAGSAAAVDIFDFSIAPNN